LKTVVKKSYETMFLVDSAEAASDWDGINALLRNVLEKAGAEIVSMKKWDECKLAYDVKGKSRGTYILCYYLAEGGKIAEVEKDVRLSGRVMRVLTLTAEHMTREDMEKDTPAVRAQKQWQQDALDRKEAEDKKGTEPEKGQEAKTGVDAVDSRQV